MAKKAIRVKTNTKVVKSSGGKNSPIKPKFEGKTSAGFLTDRIILTVKNKKD